MISEREVKHMKIAGQDYLFEQNERLRSQLQNFNTVKASESVLPVNNTQTAVSDLDKESEIGVKVDFTSSARISGNESQTSGYFPPADFSTTEADDSQNVTAGINNSVLNRYRFFVQNNQYEGSVGVVKRIFR